VSAAATARMNQYQRNPRQSVRTGLSASLLRGAWHKPAVAAPRTVKGSGLEKAHTVVKWLLMNRGCYSNSECDVLMLSDVARSLCLLTNANRERN